MQTFVKKSKLIILSFIVIIFSCKDTAELRDKERDEQKLAEEYAEIQRLSLSTNCEDAKDWTFTSIGSRACGGPASYIAYSTKIDVNAFLDLIKLYSAHQYQYNQKWGVISPCSIIIPPTGVICENGKPKLQY
ncbi:hypothetical protein [Pedobacter rhizosphaerae]|uniref:Uncharacterized protein n=1 Tax=Pedobacter rhizosphaerae TaxID=390241 RepID=A0A1H9ML30_9SPHI|nr:hypothetical protein [Pedobacter rhizosphaerae]SER24251.1 hypothetical protein SAMN04488023_10624 [Pedobacter rhizosphaerae]